MKKGPKPCILSYKFNDKVIQVGLRDNELGKYGDFEVSHTNHSLKRSIKRGITDKILSNLLSYGSCIQKQGLQYYILSKKEIKKEGLDIHLNNTVVAVVKDNIIITTYYTNKVSGHRHVQKKSKENFKNYGKFQNN